MVTLTRSDISKIRKYTWPQQSVLKAISYIPGYEGYDDEGEYFVVYYNGSENKLRRELVDILKQVYTGVRVDNKIIEYIESTRKKYPDDWDYYDVPSHVEVEIFKNYDPYTKEDLDGYIVSVELVYH